jgi:hypothetical protein
MVILKGALDLCLYRKCRKQILVTSGTIFHEVPKNTDRLVQGPVVVFDLQVRPHHCSPAEIAQSL